IFDIFQRFAYFIIGISSFLIFTLYNILHLGEGLYFMSSIKTESFSEESITEIIQQLIKKQMFLNQLRLTLKPDATLICKLHGKVNMMIPGKNAGYFDNIEDHVIKSLYCWIQPFSKYLTQFGATYQADVTANSDGSIVHDNIKIKVGYRIHGNFSIPVHFPRIRNAFSKLMLFREFITSVEFVGHQFQLSQIHFYMDLNGNQVNPKLKSNHRQNKQILDQWMATLANVIDERKGEYAWDENIPLLPSGKLASISTHTFSIKYNRIKGV